ncbi:MAG TPA: GNAT family N-acetyltransferase [Thermoanaerobaculia bacterium]|nr:GNAT family N-acetyltransferase [Thermoanaerobaculia bacterium]
MTTLAIRRAEPSDSEALRRIFSGPKAVWGTLQIPFPSAENWRKRMAESNEGTIDLVASAEEEEVVGHLFLHTFPNFPRRRHVGQLGMAVRDDWQGKGVGTALVQAAIDLADKWLNLTRLELEVYTDNEPARRLYEKFGFVIEGTLVRFAFRDGRFADVYQMARLRPDAS